MCVACVCVCVGRWVGTDAQARWYLNVDCRPSTPVLHHSIFISSHSSRHTALNQCALWWTLPVLERSETTWNLENVNTLNSLSPLQFFTHCFEYAAALLTVVLVGVWVKCQRFIRNRSADGRSPHFGDAVKRREAHLCHGWHFNLLPLAVRFPSIVHPCIRTNVMGHRRISAFNSIDRHLWLRLYCCRCREKATLTWKHFCLYPFTIHIQKRGRENQLE